MVSQMGKNKRRLMSMSSAKNRKQPREIHQSIGPRIKYFRERKKLSLHDLELKTGISASYLNRLENNYRKAPSLPILQLISESLDIPLFELLNVPKPAETLHSAGELLLATDYTVNGKIATNEIKVALCDLVDTVLASDFDHNWNQTAFKLIEQAQTVIEFAKEEQ
jgi:transcriptional regulator with XRE-family HTH domain